MCKNNVNMNMNIKQIVVPLSITCKSYIVIMGILFEILETISYILVYLSKSNPTDFSLKTVPESETPRPVSRPQSSAVQEPRVCFSLIPLYFNFKLGYFDFFTAYMQCLLNFGNYF